MADGGEKQSSVNSELLDSKISSTLYEIRELEVVNHELGCLHAKSVRRLCESAAYLRVAHISTTGKTLWEIWRELSEARTRKCIQDKERGTCSFFLIVLMLLANLEGNLMM